MVPEGEFIVGREAEQRFLEQETEESHLHSQAGSRAVANEKGDKALSSQSCLQGCFFNPHLLKVP